MKRYRRSAIEVFCVNSPFINFNESQINKLKGEDAIYGGEPESNSMNKEGCYKEWLSILGALF